MLKESRNIKDVNDFNEAAIEILENYLESFPNTNGLTRPIDEDDAWEFQERCQYMYTDRGNRLANRMIDRLNRVGNRHFDCLDLDITTHLYYEA